MRISRVKLRAGVNLRETRGFVYLAALAGRENRRTTKVRISISRLLETLNIGLARNRLYVDLTESRAVARSYLRFFVRSSDICGNARTTNTAWG